MKTSPPAGFFANQSKAFNRQAFRATACATFLFAAMFAGFALAQPTITNLGVFAGGSGAFGNDISADGSTVGGSSGVSGGGRAFRWTAGGGLQNLGILGSGPYSSASGLSSNGSVVVGISAGTGNNDRAFRWTAASGMQSLGVLGTGAASAANAVSADGSVVVGFSYTSGFNGPTAFRWTAATGMRNLNAGVAANAFDISADGSVVVGSRMPLGYERAFRWTTGGGVQDLGLLPGANAASAFTISADGGTVAGYSGDQFENTNYRAFIWTAGGGIRSLGVLEGGDFSVAWGINANGSVVVGSSTSPNGDRAFLWTSALGMVNLNSYLQSRGLNLNGWTLTSARGISANGSAISGEGLFNGQSRAFLVRGLSPLVVPMTAAPLLTTFTNPTPAESDFFGTAVAAVGSDRVLIGAEGATEAYLLSLDGTLLTTFTNPTPAVANNFGASVAAVGTDRVLIGAYQDNTGAAQAGAAYLFDTNGALLTTFTNPSPSVGANFGWSLAAVGSDRVIIGAFEAGSAYLFSTDGALLTTFANPTPMAGGYFGWSVAAVGSDRVLVSARFKNTGAGAAYLFRTDGTLLTTFNNPAPTLAENFGVSVSAVGSDRVLIGALDYARAGNGGSAYLFDTNGTLLTTFANPNPSAVQAFGLSVAAVGSDQVIIGSVWKDTGAPGAGAAYLFDLPYPPLGIALNDSNISVSWTTFETGILVQQSGHLAGPESWIDTVEPVSVTGQAHVFEQDITGGPARRFYRLHRP